MSIRLSEFELDVMTHFWSDRELSAPELLRAHRRRTRRRLFHGQDDRRPARAKGRDRARRDPRAHDLLRTGRQARARPQAARQGVPAPAVRRRFAAVVRAVAPGREAERRRARVPAQARRRSRADQEMSALGETLLTALCLSGLAACCLVLLPRTPPRVRFAIAVAGLAAWVVPWGAIRIALPSSSRQPPPRSSNGSTPPARLCAAARSAEPRRRRGARLRRRRSVPRRLRAVRARLRRAAALLARAGAPAAGRPTTCALCCRASSRTWRPRFASSSTAPSRPSPACCGRRSGSATGTREQHRTLVLAHEMWHVRARDPGVALRCRGRPARVLVEPARRVPRAASRAHDRVDVRPPLRRAVRQDELQGRARLAAARRDGAGTAPRGDRQHRRISTCNGCACSASRCACAPAISC